MPWPVLLFVSFPDVPATLETAVPAFTRLFNSVVISVTDETSKPLLDVPAFQRKLVVTRSAPPPQRHSS